MSQVFCARTYCTNVAMRLPDLGQFCGECGAALTVAPSCTCGNFLNPKLVLFRLKWNQASFCEMCGALWTEGFTSERMHECLKQTLQTINERALERRAWKDN